MGCLGKHTALREEQINQLDSRGRSEEMRKWLLRGMLGASGPAEALFLRTEVT